MVQEERYCGWVGGWVGEWVARWLGGSVGEVWVGGWVGGWVTFLCEGEGLVCGQERIGWRFKSGE